MSGNRRLTSAGIVYDFRMSKYRSLGGSSAVAKTREIEEELTGIMRRAMWSCSSSETNKVDLCGEVVKPEEERDRKALNKIWEVMKPHAHRYAGGVIKRKIASLQQ